MRTGEKYVHRIIVMASICVAVIALVLAWISQNRYQAEHKRMNGQQTAIESLTDIVSTQQDINASFVKVLRSVVLTHKALANRQLASHR